jgi:hypothetical protein
MKPIFMVVGPPAVGKSTTSRALAAHFSKSIHIPVDDLRHMVVSGLVLPGLDWGEDLVHQFHLARATVAHMALTYQNAGFTVVIDDIPDSNHSQDYEGLLNQAHIHKIILYPTQEEAHQRNLKRSGDTPARGYIDEGIQIMYQQLNPLIPQLIQEGWLLVDTTVLNVETTVTTILELAGVAA